MTPLDKERLAALRKTGGEDLAFHGFNWNQIVDQIDALLRVKEAAEKVYPRLGPDGRLIQMVGMTDLQEALQSLNRGEEEK